jgi:hypothetical protein
LLSESGEPGKVAQLEQITMKVGVAGFAAKLPNDAAVLFTQILDL